MYRRLYEEEVNAHRDSQLMNMGPVAGSDHPPFSFMTIMVRPT